MPRQFRITTTGQLERTYVVQVEDGLDPEAADAQARKRLRTYLDDPAGLREGIVIEQSADEKYTSGPRINDVREFHSPAAVTEAAKAS